MDDDIAVSENSLKHPTKSKKPTFAHKQQKNKGKKRRKKASQGTLIDSLQNLSIHAKLNSM